MPIEIPTEILPTETLPGDLCKEKFDQEMNSVDLVNGNVSVRSEGDVLPTGKKRGRPKKVDSPVTDGTVT